MWITSLDSKGKAARRRPRQKTASPLTSVFIAQRFKAVHNSSPTVLETSDGQKGVGTPLWRAGDAWPQQTYYRRSETCTYNNEVDPKHRENASPGLLQRLSSPAAGFAKGILRAAFCRH